MPLRVAGLLVSLPIAVLLSLNLFLNFGLPLLINRFPERHRMTYDVAWMILPGRIEVRNFEIRQQGPRDQWLLDVDRATITLDLLSLLSRVVHITNADAYGASFRWRARLDAPKMETMREVEDTAAAMTGEADTAEAPPLDETAPGDEVAPADEAAPGDEVEVVVAAVLEALTAPIPGLTNPPSPPPEAVYPPPNPPRVVIDGVHLDGIREIWLADYLYIGVAEASFALTVEAHQWLEVGGATLQLKGGQVIRGADPMLTTLRGQVSIEFAGVDPYSFQGRGVLGSMSGEAELTADVANLAFLDFYLKAAPWLHLAGGVGPLAIDAVFEDGAFVEGSKVSTDMHDLVVRFLSYSAVGDGLVRLTIDTVDGVPQSALTVDFLDFAITHDGDEVPHVKGRGFRVVATSPDVALDRPFTALEVVLDLPEATIPDARVYNTYLPDGIGLMIQAGTGSVRGNLEVSTGQRRCHAELFLDGEAVWVTLDDLTLGGDLSIHALVPACDVETGSYDISGTSIDLEKVRVISEGSMRGDRDDSTGWWAKARLLEGSVAVGAQIPFDASLDASFRDSIPFITVFSEKRRLPGWLRGLLAVEPVSGSVRVRLGEDVVRLSDFQLFAGKFEVLLDLRRRKEMVGKLYAHHGALGIGIGMAGGENELHLFNAREWYDEEPTLD